MVKGGGARNADDKIIQNNAASSVTIDGFSAQNFGKLYRSCGNCKGNGAKRNVTIKNVKASGGKVLKGPTDLAAMLGRLPVSVGSPEVKMMPAWSRWWLLALLIGLLTVEWVWRRRVGLA